MESFDTMNFFMINQYGCETTDRFYFMLTLSALAEVKTVENGFREGGGGGGGGEEGQSRSLTTKPDITNSRFNEAQKLNRNVSVIENSGYNEMSVITSWFCYHQWALNAAYNESAACNELYVRTL